MSVNPRSGVPYEGHVVPDPRGAWSLYDEKPIKLEPSRQEIVRRQLRSVTFHRMPETPVYKDLHVAQIFSPSGLQALVLLTSCNSAGSFRDLDEHLAHRAPLFLGPSNAIMDGLSQYLDVSPPMVWSVWDGSVHRPLDWPCFGPVSALKAVGAVDEFARWLLEALGNASADGEVDHVLIPSVDEMESRLLKFLAAYLEDKFEWTDGCFTPTSTLKVSPLFWGVETRQKYLYSARAAFLALHPADPLGRVHSVQRWCGHRFGPSAPLVDLTTDGVEGNPESKGPSPAPVVEVVEVAVAPADATLSGSASASGVAEQEHGLVANAPFPDAAVPAPVRDAAVEASGVELSVKARKNKAQRKRKLAQRGLESGGVGGGPGMLEAAAVAPPASSSSATAPPARGAPASRGRRGGSKRRAVGGAAGGEVAELRKRLQDKENECSSLRSAFEGSRGRVSRARRSGSRAQPRGEERMDQLIGVVGEFAKCVPALVAMASKSTAPSSSRPRSPPRSSSSSSSSFRRPSSPRDRRDSRPAHRGSAFQRGGAHRGQRGGPRPQRRANSRWDQPPPASAAPSLPPSSPLPLGPPPVVRLPVPTPSSSSPAPSVASSVVVVSPAPVVPVPESGEPMDCAPAALSSSSSSSSSRRFSPIRYPAPRPRSDNVDVRVKDGHCTVVRDNGADE